MGHTRDDVERTKRASTKYVCYREGAEKYCMGMTKFQELAKRAKAVYKVGRMALVNCELFECYLEGFRLK